jgi:hypothetical protein
VAFPSGGGLLSRRPQGDDRISTSLRTLAPNNETLRKQLGHDSE